MIPAAYAREQSKQYSLYHDCLNRVEEQIGSAIERGKTSTCARLPEFYNPVLLMVKGALKELGYTVDDTSEVHVETRNYFPNGEVDPFTTQRSLIIRLSW